MDIKGRVEAALGMAPGRLESLSGGCIGTVYRAEMPGGQALVVKVGGPGEHSLEIEGDMLRHLREQTELPVPQVHHAERDLLVMDYVAHSGQQTPAAHEHAAELLAALHEHTASDYGFERTTLIGPLDLPNPWTASWPVFFAEHRLLYMGRLCLEHGRFGATTFDRLERLAADIDRHIDHVNPPSLIHGDVWGGNVLFDGEAIAAFVDPAIYYGDCEMELAFTTLFSTFGQAFYDRYDAIRGIDAGFWEVRRDLYNLFPLLVHVRLFGGGYLRQVEGILDGLGV